ncbi:MAG TPA: nucleotidyltransferase family protein [Stellaceae bacterium]|nr:nucleotidyltransferase family protein [Stellaceae bacterium]
MDRDQIIGLLRAHEGDLRERGVRRAALFGSVARASASPTSDIDILVELDPEAPIDLYAYARLKTYISGLFNGPVDVIDRDALKPYLRRTALTDAIYAF